MKTINNSRFDELFKISIYRDITEQLLEHRLITDSEYKRICHRIDSMEDALIKPPVAADPHSREATAL